MFTNETIQTKKHTAEKRNYLDLTTLIQSIQRAEGNPDCFRKANGYCDRLDCAWRKYCLEEPEAIVDDGRIDCWRRDETKGGIIAK